ncbi:DUF4352 domain-containing protein [Nocardioides sp. YIM 152588]|uniref:DUF4352 domain-containing protein n=1 Tax=Nocardioides sp. YIM 152588 TaxID=3158259 RepID=UPI0032E47554
MTDQYTPAPQPTDYKDAKAQAKAAKAYAKAQRPWFKKKRFIIPIALVVLIVIVQATGGGDADSEPDNSSQASGDNGGSTAGKAKDSETQAKAEEKAEEKADVGTTANPAPRGTAVANESAKYRVDDVSVRDSLGQFADAPAGAYVVVSLTVQNVKDESIQISSLDFTLQVNGTEIDASDDAIFLDDAFAYEDLSPGLKKSGVVVFDVAPKHAGTGVLKAQAALSLDEAVYLNLEK